jgi:hypothetical protein
MLGGHRSLHRREGFVELEGHEGMMTSVLDKAEEVSRLGPLSILGTQFL